MTTFDFASLAKPREYRKLLLFVPNNDISYLPASRTILNKYFNEIIPIGKVVSLKGLDNLIAEHSVTHIATTSFEQLNIIDIHLDGKQTNNIGTKLEYNSLPVIQLPPLRQYYTTSSGGFLLDHFCKKLTTKFLTKSELDWCLLTPSNFPQAEKLLNETFLTAVDIETLHSKSVTSEEIVITHCSWTAGYECEVTKKIKTKTYVLDFTQLPKSEQTYSFYFELFRRLNQTKSPKVMQNGRYDATWFLRFGVPLHNWLYDTYNLFHCLYPELPKTLEFQSSFILDDFRFWHSGGNDSMALYNAKDTHNTFWTWIGLVQHAMEDGNQYAFSNYYTQFPLNFPCISMGMDGLAMDFEERERGKAERVKQRDEALTEIRTITGLQDFNPNSPPQTTALMKAMGFQATSSDVKTLTRFAQACPLNDRLVNLITSYRESVKAISTYFEFEPFYDRILYAIDPAGTDSGRMSSSKSHFWCGAQVQNFPRYARLQAIADEGFKFVAVDKAQAESYCTGYISGEEKLIEAVETSPDFHCFNASAFFGIPFEELYDEATGTKLNVPIRDLSKRVNHGANYNMGYKVLRETMGDKNVVNARNLLGLPQHMTLDNVCRYLLLAFDKTYPRVRGAWQQELIREIELTGRLTTDDGWVRRTFLNPRKSKLDLNTVVSHKPQGFSARLVNKALMYIWKELQLKKYRGKFRLKAQIHDEILSCVHESLDVEKVAKEIADIMVIKTKVTCGLGITREFSIPSTYEIGETWAEVS